MVGPVERIRRSLVAHIRGIVDDHRADGLGPDGELTCECGAEGPSDHPRHVAEQIVDGLALKPENVDEVKKRLCRQTDELPVAGVLYVTRKRLWCQRRN